MRIESVAECARERAQNSTSLVLLCYISATPAQMVFQNAGSIGIRLQIGVTVALSENRVLPIPMDESLFPHQHGYDLAMTYRQAQAIHDRVDAGEP